MEFLLNYLLEFLKIMAWPLICYFFLTTYKTNIGDLISKVKKFGFFGGNIETGQTEAPSQSTTSEQDLVKATKQIKSIKTKSKNTKEKLQKTVDNLLVILEQTNKWLDYEKIYRMIFGSQIEFLKFVESIDGKKSTKETSEKFFMLNAKSRFPDSYKDWDAQIYFSFLVRNDLLKYDDFSSLFPTQKSEDFLKYIETSRYPNKAL